MSTPIYDALCEAMPGPDGRDEEEAALPAQGTEVDGAADQNGHASGPGAANGKVGAAHEGDSATTHNGRVESNGAADDRRT